jgi:hypothetical protein
MLSAPVRPAAPHPVQQWAPPRPIPHGPGPAPAAGQTNVVGPWPVNPAAQTGPVNSRWPGAGPVQYPNQAVPFPPQPAHQHP